MSKKDKDIADNTEEMRNFYENIIACMPNNVYWLDKNCVLQGGNDNIAKLFGVKRSELAGLTYEQMSKLANWTEGQGESFKQVELEVMRTGVARYNTEEPPITVDGRTTYFISSKVPLYNSKKEIIGVVGISTDITERKEAEINLKEAKEKAEIANKTKTEFLENMRHDIRTPLMGIVGFAHLIAEEVKDPKIQEYIENLTASSNALLDLLNEILEAIRVNAGEVPILKKKFDLHKRLSNVVELYRAKAQQKHIQLSFDYDPNISRYLVGDSTRIHRIVLELIANALNFTNKGTVTLRVQLAKDIEREQILKIIVEDTGIGIVPEKSHEIFMQFKRLTPSYEGIYKGAGLGLAIVKQFIDELEGEIYVDSTIDVGTKFTCIIPLKKPLLDEEFGCEDNIPPVKNSIEFEKTENFKNVKIVSSTASNILLVEDNVLAIKIVTMMLSGLDCHVDVAENGKAGIELVKKNTYDLIFMDIGLPDMDGYEVTKRIRLHELSKGIHVPIIALTAHADEENTQRCIAVGMNAVLSKPLTKEKAEDILKAFIPYRKKSKKAANVVVHNKTTPEMQVLDLAVAKQLANNDENLMYEMLGMLKKSLPQEIKNMEVFYKNENWTEIQKAVHKLKSGAGYCGALRLSDACSKLEAAILKNNKTSLSDFYQQFVTELHAVEKAIKEKNLA